MRLKEMIDLLRFPQRMQIRDEEGWEIFTCNTTSEGVLPYMNWVVTQWFGNYKDGKADFVVYVKETDDVPAEKERRMRLIDVDKFEEKNAKVWEQCGREDCYYSVGYILSQASVDATLVIRCKDCKWYEMGEEETYCRELGIFNTDPTSYCSYARRKEE